MFSDKRKELCLKLIEKSQLLGLSNQTRLEAKEFAEYHEFGLCLDLITTQINEYDIAIDDDFLGIVFSLADKMNISKNNFHFLKRNLNS